MSDKLIHKHNYNPFKTRHLIYLLIPSIIFAFTVAYFNQKKESNVASAIAVVTPKPFITIKTGNTVINTEIVDDSASRATGLSKYDQLPENQGMLFVFDQRDIEHANFWMKNMKFAIDIIWVNDSKVVQIDKNVQPQPGVPDSELNYYLNNQPIDYVLEVNAGFSEKNNILVGTFLDIEAF